MTKTPRMRCIEHECGKPLEQILAEMVAAGLSWEDIAFKLGVTRLTLRDWTRHLRARVVTRRILEFDPAEPASVS